MSDSDRCLFSSKFYNGEWLVFSFKDKDTTQFKNSKKTIQNLWIKLFEYLKLRKSESLDRKSSAVCRIWAT
ncbi:hypothetical protein BpHYR1_003389 [Brachionus plicatilis]|uniref:Uncharacterized protein n=1 Tax=Brachionus plicatilis TaxID=10195 RepID=A0A3M7SY58_BRAPC|nr:hypothetical protein BpHYR1_003389 [Brachionus plicatilis]